MRDETKKKIWTYVIAIALPLFVGALSALLTRKNMNIYEEINTPPLSPPGILFPIVWSILYVLMGISSAAVWLQKDGTKTAPARGLTFYAISLAFNFVWSIIFFNARAYLVAFLWLVALLLLIILTMVWYARVKKWTAVLQIPYLLWVTFAGYLNLAIVILN